MFQYPVLSSSTGEPPTTEAQSRSLPTTATSGDAGHKTTTAHHHRHQHHQSGGTTSGSSLTAQEPDSGYEASPSSVADNSSERCSFRFEGDNNQQRQSEDNNAERTDFEFENMTDSMLLDGLDMEEWDTCPDCGSPATCVCCFRAESSTATNTVTEDTCDNNTDSECSSQSNNHIDNRPSSLPITIPVINRSLTPPSVSRPIAVERSHVVFRAAQPLSWPFSALALLSSRGAEMVPRFLRNLSPHQESLLRASRQRQNACIVEERSRRRRVNSDDSLSSSDSDGPEDVFNMSEEAPRVSPNPSTSPVAIGGSAPSAARLQQPLPDVVQSSPEGGRRGRSISVNLPPEPELLRSIGRSLIRLSDQFQRGREFCNGSVSGRRRTASDIYNLKRSS